MNCVVCVHFVNDPAAIEAMIPGLAILGSARASVRANDGFCVLHDRMADPEDSCGGFSRRLRSDPRQP